MGASPFYLFLIKPFLKEKRPFFYPSSEFTQNFIHYPKFGMFFEEWFNYKQVKRGYPKVSPSNNLAS